MTSINETETHDLLPFTLTDADAILAPSIEEVDSNPDELRNMRGEGRYFGLEDSDIRKTPAKKCRNCNGTGHIAKNCPHVICTYCGAVDDHYPQQCSKTIKCSNCNESGHYRSQCPKKWRKVFCSICDSKRHSRERCPSIWRSYTVLEHKNSKINKNKVVLRWDKIWCYNCGSKGHFGDDCSEARSSRVPLDDGSAFSGDNLPETLRNEYWKNLKAYMNDRYYANGNGTVKGSYNSRNAYNNDYSRYDSYAGNSSNSNHADYDNSYRKFNNNNSSSPFPFHPPPYGKSSFTRSMANYDNKNNSASNYNSRKNNSNNADKKNSLEFPRGGSLYDDIDGYSNSGKRKSSNNKNIYEKMNKSRYSSGNGSSGRSNAKSYNVYESFGKGKASSKGNTYKVSKKRR
ncbi:TRAMP complex RNA-binding subunit SCDLUD_000309 [Saccharomycodes ludwigii]|uniref:TRAMP complex RNA-binding subunit n=1 Tax=Saccharomycodes ludwigii TaxID=36035 RepID=UPI001E89C6DA|nr:hypothetical protein SCDLUD_000309 [Saccharomycodes ludwigii]KAH3902723.1 hypothetical protein SCDLUD_000309 [Saccharomycodes ludwigii]